LGRKDPWSRKVFLQDVVTTGCSDDGTTFAVVDLRDATNASHLTLVTRQGFGDIEFLGRLRGIEVSLDPASAGIVLLPLAQQSPAVRQHLLDQLLSCYRDAVAEDRDPSTAVEALITLLEQVIGGT
jgi:hypothetical protein